MLKFSCSHISKLLCLISFHSICNIRINKINSLILTYFKTFIIKFSIISFYFNLNLLHIWQQDLIFLPGIFLPTNINVSKACPLSICPQIPPYFQLKLLLLLISHTISMLNSKQCTLILKDHVDFDFHF